MESITELELCVYGLSTSEKREAANIRSITSRKEYLQNIFSMSENEQLPQKIRDSARFLYDAYEGFVDTMTDYLEGSKRKDAKISVAREILNVCPEALMSKPSRNLLIQRKMGYILSRGITNYSQHVQLYAEIGTRYGIGGPNGRGGLICNYRNYLVDFAKLGNDNMLRVLSTSTPPLLTKEDVKDFSLLHMAVSFFSKRQLETVKLLLELDPSSINQRDKNGELPLKASCGSCNENPKIFLFLLRKGLESSIPLSGGLFDNNTFETAMIHFKKDTCETESRGFISSPPPDYFGDTSETESRCFISSARPDYFGDFLRGLKSVFSAFPNRASLVHRAIKFSMAKGKADNLSLLVEVFPEDMTTKNKDGRIPVHFALEAGAPWSAALVAMLSMSNGPLDNTVDPVTKLHPFMLAASRRKSCDLQTIFHLLRRNPHHVKGGIVDGLSGSKRKRVHNYLTSGRRKAQQP